MEILGVINKIFDIKTFPSGFVKQEIILVTNEKYPQNLCIEFIQDKINILKSFKIGDNVKVLINLKGREWTNPNGITKYFNTIQGWKIENINNDINPSLSNINISNNSNIIKDSSSDEFDELPF